MMMSKRIFSLLLLTISFILRANAVELSDSSKISLLTCAPGKELYSAFGHTGIRIIDYKKHIDVVFNYGTFDDQQPGFYVNFVKGRMIYSITYDNFPDFMAEYVEEKRGVVEQDLKLTSEDKQKVFDLLYQNALPENRNYPYDFFWDNCCTRPRDIFEKVLGSRLEYKTDSSCGFAQNKTMHDMLRLYVHNRPWVDFGFDLILGLPCEVPATPRNQTFLPDYVSKLFGCAAVDGQPFVTNTHNLLDYSLPVFVVPFQPVYLTTFLMLLGFFVFFMERRRGTHYYGFDFFVFLIAGLWGIFFICLWAFTTHYSLPKNLNMLWLMPTHFIAAFLLLKKEKPLWLKYYFLFTYVLMMVLLFGWKHNPQPYNIAFAPLIILLAARAITIFTDQQRHGTA
jgi:hypothetical protein